MAFSPLVGSANAQLTFGGTGFGPIPDATGSGARNPGTPLDVLFTVSGVTGNVTNIAVDLTMTHTFLGDISVTLFSPNGTFSLVLFAYTGATTGTSFGDNSDLGATYTFSDTAMANWWTTATALTTSQVMPAGSYRTSQSGGAGSTGAFTSLDSMFGGMTPAQANGIWTLRFTDGAAADMGSVSDAHLFVTFAAVPEPVTTGICTAAVLGGILLLRTHRRRRA